MSGFLYDATVSIWRDASTDGQGGLQSYGGRERSGAKDELVLDGLAASIQPKGRQRSNDADLPGEAPKAQWEVLLRRGQPQVADIRRGMIVKDDIGREFLIFAADPSPLGWRFLCDQLEV